jgi:hypothetical protein
MIDDTAIVPRPEHGRGRDTIQAISLDDLCVQRSIAPTILKIDVYGGEGMVVQGMSRLLQDSIQVVLLELHPLHEYRSCSPGYTRAGIIEPFERCGFSVFYVAGHRGDDHSDLAAYREEGRFAYVRLTAATVQLMLFDRSYEILIIACRGLDVADVLGPPLDLADVAG